MPTVRYTGKGGYASVAGVNVTAILGEWNAEMTSTNVEIPAAGDIATHRTHVRVDWKATVQMVFPSSSIPNFFDDVGTAVAFAGHVVTPSLGLFVATGMVTATRVVSSVSDGASLEVDLQCSDGSAVPTFTPGA